MHRQRGGHHRGGLGPEDAGPQRDGQRIKTICGGGGTITGFITAKQAADIHFFSRKQFAGQDDVDGKAREILSKIFALFSVLDSLAEDCLNAIGINNGDYEDAMMIETASRSGVDCIVTRNEAHFRAGTIPVYAPEEFVQKFL